MLGFGSDDDQIKIIWEIILLRVGIKSSNERFKLQPQKEPPPVSSTALLMIQRVDGFNTGRTAGG